MRPQVDPVRPSPSRVGTEAVAVGLVVLGYLWLWRIYGFDLVDEGTQLLQISRVAEGARPYLDFETGYTPGYFAIHAWLWEFGGFAATRTFGVLVQAVVAATTYVLLRNFGGFQVAISGIVGLVAFLLPVSLSQGAPSNIPYPGWLALPGVIAATGLLASLVAPHSPLARRLRIFLAGLAIGFVFSVKPNTGLFLIVGAGLALASSWRMSHRAERLLGRLLRLAALAAIIWFLHPVVATRLGPALLVPVVLAIIVAGPPRNGGRRSAFSDLASLVAGFSLFTLFWMIPVIAQIGVDGVATRILFLGGGAQSVAEAYFLDAPAFGPDLIALLVGLLVVVSVARTRAARLAPLALLLTLVVAGFFMLEEGMRIASEKMLFWLAPVSLATGLMTVGPDLARQRERILLILASCLLMTLYPRPDLVHVAQIGPLLVLGALPTWHRVATTWRRERGLEERARTVVASILALFVGLVGVVRIAPSLAPRLTQPIATVGLGPLVEIEVLEEEAEHYRELARLVSAIRDRTADEDPVLTFPDLAGLALLADRPSPFYYLYFVPGRPDWRQAKEIVAQWREVRPRLLALGEPQVPAFRAATHYFAPLLTFLESETRAEAEIMSVELRVPKDQGGVD